MGKMIKVGMADLNLCQAPDAITTLGLGSCVGVVLYDANIKIAGLVHVHGMQEVTGSTPVFSTKQTKATDWVAFVVCVE